MKPATNKDEQQRIWWRKIPLLSSILPSTSSAKTISSATGSTGGSLYRLQQRKDEFIPYYASTALYETLSKTFLKRHCYETCHFCSATWIGFWALLHVTCATYVLTPIRDAVALQIGVEHIPKLTLASTVLAFCSSVPIGWLFEAPDPSRRRLFKRMGLTRGETQGTSLALFYRFFAVCLISYAIGFYLIEVFIRNNNNNGNHDGSSAEAATTTSTAGMMVESVQKAWRDVMPERLYETWVSLGLPANWEAVWIFLRPVGLYSILSRDPSDEVTFAESGLGCHDGSYGI